MDWRYRGSNLLSSRSCMTSICRHRYWKAARRSYRAIVQNSPVRCIETRLAASFSMVRCSDARLMRCLTCCMVPIGKASCLICSQPLLETSQSLLLLFLCRHVVHSRCVSKNELVPNHADIGLARSGISGKIALCVHSDLTIATWVY